jgi:predicted HicB family RNase H-like nuclease
MMQYKGYTGVLEVDVESQTLCGRVLGLRDVITFQAKTVEAARVAFEESVEDYLSFCAQRNEKPEKPYSGKFLVRIKPSTHRALAMKAEIQEISLNALVERVLEDHISLNAMVERILEQYKTENPYERLFGESSARGVSGGLVSKTEETKPQHPSRILKAIEETSKKSAQVSERAKKSKRS